VNVFICCVWVFSDLIIKNSIFIFIIIINFFLIFFFFCRRKRTYRERAQPKKRKHLGLLEKHKDYVERWVLLLLFVSIVFVHKHFPNATSLNSSRFIYSLVIHNWKLYFFCLRLIWMLLVRAIIIWKRNVSSRWEKKPPREILTNFIFAWYHRKRMK